MASDAIKMVPKIVRWTRKVGLVSPGLPNIPKGELYYRGYQLTSGKNKHSGPSGKRAFRFYQGAYRSDTSKKVSRA